MIREISAREFFINYGILTAFLAVIFGILIYTVKVTRKSWSANLRPAVESVLDEKFPNEWMLGSPVPLEGPEAMNAACYEIRNRNSGAVSRAVILRMNTFMGPVPAVFIYPTDGEAYLAGFPSLHGKTARLAESGIQGDTRIRYWELMIPGMMK